MIRNYIIIAFFLLLSACISIPVQPTTPSSNCLSFYSEFDHLIDDEDIQDVQASQLANYPYLSVNRFLLSFRLELGSEEKLNYWVSLLAKENREARHIEWLNLSGASRQKLTDNFLDNVTFTQWVSTCSELLQQKLTGIERTNLSSSAQVTSDYSLLQRFFGVYPLSSLIVSRQIKKHQQQTRQVFEMPLEALPIEGNLVRYSLALNNTGGVNKFSFKNPLSIPTLTSNHLQQLFEHYAPTIEVDERDKNDKIGRLILNSEQQPSHISDKAIFYVLPSYVRFNGKVLMQLNYFFWFASRPSTHLFDIYSGKFDGLIWRVTLNHNGEPLLYDSVHSCGCYHKFYLGEKLVVNQENIDSEKEPPFIAQMDVSKTPLVVRVSSSAHFVTRVYPLKFNLEAKSIEIKPYSQLRNLGDGERHSSFFGSDSLVDGSSRFERWLLWPMGVPSAGAMRQWGHHVVAFVGRRYFDDPYLLDKYFRFKK